MNTLKLRWQDWTRRFAAFQAREKYMVTAATATAVLFGGYSLWVEPGLLQAERLKKTLVQHQAEQGQLQEQVASLAARNSDPDSANRAELQRLREEIAAKEGEIGGFGNTLVAPQGIPALLQTLLGRHRGLVLLGLKTLPPQPLIEPPESKERGKTKQEPVAMPGGNLYRHGIEIKLAGAYQELLAYVAELDASPQKLLRGGLSLTVRQYPVSELTLMVYTLSLDPTWLVV